MDVAQFDFELSEDLIALRPMQPRDAARMLVVREDGGIEHTQVRDLPRYLRAGDSLVVNDTRVIPARLRGVRTGRATEPKIELLLYRKTGDGQFMAFARPARKLDAGDGVRLGQHLTGRVIAKPDSGSVEVAFDRKGAAFDAALAAEGEMPLPPYIAGKRKADARDAADYQTTFARRDGSVAAPTAGLHLTPELLERLRADGVGRESVTLHVGPGTFLPVTANDTAEHRMHAEWAELTADAAGRLNAVRAVGGRVVPVGTTSLRTLESATAGGTLAPFSGETNIFITPGYGFRVADILMTNFHLPRSTLFMLVSAFIGLEKAQAVYAEAIRERYRFYSYGDACLLFRQP